MTPTSTTTTTTTATAADVPIIDLSSFANDNASDEQQQVANQLREACENTGFFYITGHGCDASIIENMMTVTRQFFDLPLTSKLELEASKNPLWRGYNSLETGSHSCTPEAKHSTRDHKESFTIGTEGTGISPMHGPNQWPLSTDDSNFEATARQYWNSISHVVAIRLMKALAMSLDLPQDFFVSKCQRSTHSQMVLLRYPPSKEGTDTTRGCGAHTDCGFLTILLQDYEGLEVKRADGTWVSAPPLDHHFVVNLGDMMAHWTNDRYQSTEHRVYNPSPTVTRHSIPFFYTVDYDTLVETIPSCRNYRQGKVYEPVKSGEYILQKLGLMYLAEINDNDDNDDNNTDNDNDNNNNNEDNKKETAETKEKSNKKRTLDDDDDDDDDNKTVDDCATKSKATLAVVG